jgi:hypothetical protein
MQLVAIQGPKEILQALLDAEGLVLSIQSAKQQSADTWSISGYVSDATAAELRARGCIVETIMSHEEVQTAIDRGRGRSSPRGP